MPSIAGIKSTVVPLLKAAEPLIVRFNTVALLPITATSRTSPVPVLLPLLIVNLATLTPAALVEASNNLLSPSLAVEAVIASAAVPAVPPYTSITSFERMFAI